MPHIRNSWLTLALLLLALRWHASAQTDQLLPEINVYYKLNPDLRIWFQAKETRVAANTWITINPATMRSLA